MYATARRASSALCTNGRSTVSAPASSTRFTITMSFQGGRTIACAGVPAMARVVERLGIEADVVVFGHVHRRGPLDGERWPEENGTRFINTGSWLYEPLLVDRVTPPHGYWPGGGVLIEPGRAPRSVGLLDDLAAEQLRPAPPTSAVGAGSAATGT